MSSPSSPSTSCSLSPSPSNSPIKGTIWWHANRVVDVALKGIDWMAGTNLMGVTPPAKGNREEGGDGKGTEERQQDERSKRGKVTPFFNALEEQPSEGSMASSPLAPGPLQQEEVEHQQQEQQEDGDAPYLVQQEQQEEGDALYLGQQEQQEEGDAPYLGQQDEAGEQDAAEGGEGAASGQGAAGPAPQLAPKAFAAVPPDTENLRGRDRAGVVDVLFGSSATQKPFKCLDSPLVASTVGGLAQHTGRPEVEQHLAARNPARHASHIVITIDGITCYVPRQAQQPPGQRGRGQPPMPPVLVSTAQARQAVQAPDSAAWRERWAGRLQALRAAGGHEARKAVLLAHGGYEIGYVLA